MIVNPYLVSSGLVLRETRRDVGYGVRLRNALGSMAETWLGMQSGYDIWEARSRM